MIAPGQRRAAAFTHLAAAHRHLKGFMAHRARLLAAGIMGFQLLDGSFVEDIESTESRPPSDIDVVTFHGRSPALIAQSDWIAFVKANLDVFLWQQSKPKFKVDAYFVDFLAGAHYVVQMTSFWCGLFSHKRERDFGRA